MSSRFDAMTGILVGTVTVAAIVITQPAVAKSPREVAEIAIPTTVQINNPLDALSSGSGVIIAKKGKTYTVLTANHVVASEAVEQYIIRTADKKEHETTSVRRLQSNPGNPDLAVVTFESDVKYPVAPIISNSDLADIGTGVYVSGFPLPTPAIPERVYSFFGGQVVSRLPSGERGYTLVYDAETIRGMSGGPVFDVNGRVVAIHGVGDALNQVVNRETGRQQPANKTGRNLGIPINTFMALLSQVGMQRSDFKMDSSAPSDDVASTPPPEDVRRWYVDIPGFLRPVLPRRPRLPFGL